jgi:hypothetical protein
MYFKSTVSKRHFSASITILILLTLSSVGFGQSSYTNIYVSGNDVVAYGQMSGTYMMGSHVDTTNISLYGPSSSATGFGGTSASASLPIGGGGIFNAYTSHDSFCPDSGVTYYGVASSSASITVSVSSCTDTCTPCRDLRQPKEIVCSGGLAVCEAQAFNTWNNAMTTCENNNFCNPNSPVYNPDQCENCKDTANTTYAVAIAGCLAGWQYVCRPLITPDCDTFPTYQKGDCSACSNWPPL